MSFVCVCVCVFVCLFVCLFVCDIKSEYHKKTHVSDLSKFDALLHKTRQTPSGTKVPRPGMCISIISLNKIAHQMWRDHPFSQRSKTTERVVGLGVVGNREGGRGA